MKRLTAALSVILLAIGLLYTASLMPPMGAAKNPTKVNTIPRYLEYGAEEGGAENIVTGIILNYRGYDTLGEVAVIFSAMIGVLAVLSRERKGNTVSRDSPLQPTVAIVTTVRFLVPFIILFSIYTILNGDVLPGGGFQGGAIIGASLIIFTTVFGFEESLRKIPLRFRALLEGAAVMTFILVGLISTIFGTSFLTYILPGVPETLHLLIRTVMLLLIEISIGIGGAMIFTSILFALLGEE